jgi:hypothetical protein
MQPTDTHPLPETASLEELGLSVRTRNALKGVGCNTVGDVLRLDLERPIRGLGKLAKEELLIKLERAGSPHPSEAEAAADITRLERNLERMQRRLDAALLSISRELEAARQRVRRLRIRPIGPGRM